MVKSIAPAAADNPSFADLVAFIQRLGRPGARLRSRPTGSTIVSTRPRRDATLPTPPVSDAVIQAARAAGYLLVETGDGPCGPVEVLSAAGRIALRAALMAGPAQPLNRSRPSRHGTRRAALATQSNGQRVVDRMTVVEQLGLRRDRHGQPLLSETQVAAALRLAQDFAMGAMHPKVTARWSTEAIPDRGRRGAPGAGVDLAAATAAAQARVRAALSCLSGGLANIVVDVCCFERGLESVEADRRWPSHAARVVLGMALNDLAAHYGMGAQRRTRAAVRQWGDGDFLPNGPGRAGPGSD